MVTKRGLEMSPIKNKRGAESKSEIFSSSLSRNKKGAESKSEIFSSSLSRNKKGAEMTIGTLVIIVLAIAVLVLLIVGFSMGWTNLWGKIIGLGGGGSNVDTIRQSCALACTGQQQYSYCEENRTIKITGQNDIENTCKGFAEGTNSFGIEKCPGLCPD